MDLEFVDQIKTADDALKAIRAVAKAAKELDANLQNTQAMVTDLRAANETLTRELAEARTAAPPAGSERELRKYVIAEDKGIKGIRLVGTDKGDAGYEPGLLDEAPICEWQREFQRLVHQRTMVKVIRANKIGDYGDSPISDRQVERHIRTAPDPIRKIFSSASGSGGDWIPTVMSPQVWETLKLERRVAGLFNEFPMTDKTMDIPFDAVGATPYLKGTATSDDPAQYRASTPTTAKRTLTAKGMAVRIIVDEDASEDAIIATMPFLDRALIDALRDGEEDALINGDTAAPHQDTIAGWNPNSRWASAALGGSDDHRRWCIGLRARAADVSNTTDQSAAATAAGLNTAIGKLDPPHGLDMVAIVCGYHYFLKTMRTFTEVLTVDKFGPNATILRGQLAALFGAPIIISDFVTADLNASGIYDNSTKTKTGFLVVNRSRFVRGVRRGVAVEAAKDITRGVHHLVATNRGTFDTMDSSTTKNVHWSYNLTP